jgi:tRNA threonylcarbamoyl adenosine modification protein (Sua5/YciO/YrdC/YwlC family)
MPAARVLPISPAAIAEAADHLRAGRLVAFPTETVYGLGGNALDDLAVAKIFAAKGRPSFNPLITHVPDVEAARRLAHFDSRAEKLAVAFWPGPMTLVLPRAADCPISALASAGLDTLALRVPKHPAARDLLRAAGLPLAAPSANPSGRLSPTTAAHVAEAFGDQVALILDGGPCTVGLESTVVGLAGGQALLLRPGIVPQGGNTGLVGGQIPHHNEIVLSLNRLDRIREVDPTSNTMTCEAGVTCSARARRRPRPTGCYPLLPSEGTCTIGGNLSTNAGGTAALAYGIARSHALGLEVVLADGRVLNNLNKLKKDNTGYDLKKPVHRRRRHARHHHRGGAAAGAAAARGRDRFRRRRKSPAPRWSCSASRNEAPASPAFES